MGVYRCPSCKFDYVSFPGWTSLVCPKCTARGIPRKKTPSKNSKTIPLSQREARLLGTILFEFSESHNSQTWKVENRFITVLQKRLKDLFSQE